MDQRHVLQPRAYSTRCHCGQATWSHDKMSSGLKIWDSHRYSYYSLLFFVGKFMNIYSWLVTLFKLTYRLLSLFTDHNNALEHVLSCHNYSSGSQPLGPPVRRTWADWPGCGWRTGGEPRWCKIELTKIHQALKNDFVNNCNINSMVNLNVGTLPPNYRHIQKTQAF